MVSIDGCDQTLFTCMTLLSALQLPTPHVNNAPNEVHEEMMNQGLKWKMEGLIVLKQKKHAQQTKHLGFK